MMRICSILTIMRMGMVIIMGAIAPSYPLPAMTRIISVAKKMAKIAKGMDTVKIKVQNKSNGELFQIHFFSFHGCFSLSLTQGVLFSQEKNFPFG